MTAKYNLHIQQHSTVNKYFKFLTVDNTPMDLTGYTVSSQIRANYNDTASAATFTASIITQTSGTVELKLNPADTALLTGSCYFYDIRLQAPSGSTYYPIEGKVTVSPSVTRG